MALTSEAIFSTRVIDGFEGRSWSWHCRSPKVWLPASSSIEGFTRVQGSLVSLVVSSKFNCGFSSCIVVPFLCTARSVMLGLRGVGAGVEGGEALNCSFKRIRSACWSAIRCSLASYYYKSLIIYDKGAFHFLLFSLP